MTKNTSDKKVCEKCGKHSYSMYLNENAELICDKCIDKERESAKV